MCIRDRREELHLDKGDIERLYRYAMEYGEGGFQDRIQALLKKLEIIKDDLHKILRWWCYLLINCSGGLNFDNLFYNWPGWHPLQRIVNWSHELYWYQPNWTSGTCWWDVSWRDFKTWRFLLSKQQKQRWGYQPIYWNFIWICSACMLSWLSLIHI